MAKGKGFGDLDDRAQAATKGVKALGGAFEELSKKGSLSAQSIGQITSALASVNPALGAVAAAAGVAYRSFKMLEELELADQFALFSVGARQMVTDFERFAVTTTASVEASDELRQKTVELAEAQFALKAKTDAVHEAAAKQTKEAAAGNANAEGALKSYIQTVIDQFPASAKKVEDIKAEIAAIKEQTAATARAKEAQDDFNANVARENAVFEARRKGRAEFSTFASKSGAEEIQLLEVLAGQYERQYDLEIARGDVNAATTLQNLRNTQDRIDALEREAEMQARVGAMAESAIAGIAAGAFDAYAEALDKTVSMNALFQSSTDRTLRNVAASTIRNVGRQAAIEGAMELARAAAALAIGNYPSASLHGQAAAGFFAVAAAAGAAAGATSVKAPSGGGGGRGRDAGSGGPSGSGGPTIHVTVIGSLDTQARKDLGAQLREEFYEGGVG